MYDELVKSLRELCEMTALCDDHICFECPYEEKCSNYKNGRLSVVYRQAADAIEELSKLHETQKRNLSVLTDELMSRWIPVTERLPKKEREIYWICTDSGYQCECRWTNNRYGFGESDNWGWHIMDTPQYQKVTAWRELPDPYEPPKENDNGN